MGPWLPLLVILLVVSALALRLRRSEGRFRLLAEHSSDIVGYIDTDANWLYVSPSVERLLGYRPAELVGHNSYEIAHPDDRLQMGDHGQLREGEVFRVRRKDGSYVWMESNTNPITNRKGEATGAVSVLRDVTQRKRAEDLYRYLIRHLPKTAVFLFNRRFEHLVADGIESLGGQAIPSMEGRTLHEVFGTDMAEVLAPHYANVFDGSSEVTEQSYRTRTYQIHFLPVRDATTGSVDLGMAVFLDVTEQKRIIQALQDQALDLERSNRDLERFANVASHELKSPLRRIASFAELLAEDFEGLLSDEADEYIHHIGDGVRSLSEVIEALLVYSRVRTDVTRMDWVDLNDVCAEAVQALATCIAETGADVRCAHLPTVTGDRVLLKQLLQNLINNAIKFYDGDGHPIVHVSSDRDLLDWEISIADNGPGIDPGQHSRIFEMFQRLRPDVVGSGIGLALCKKIVSIHRGKIWVATAALGGSDFRFRLPAKSPDEVVDATASLPPGRYNPFDT